MPSLLFAPSSRIEIIPVQRATSLTAGTRNLTQRIDTRRYGHIVLYCTSGVIAAGTPSMTLTPVCFDGPTGGTGVRLDGTNGQADERLFMDGTDDNLSKGLELRCHGLPGRWLNIERIDAGTNTIAIVAFCAIDKHTSTLVDFTALSGHIGFI